MSQMGDSAGKVTSFFGLFLPSIPVELVWQWLLLFAVVWNVVLFSVGFRIWSLRIQVEVGFLNEVVMGTIQAVLITES